MLVNVARQEIKIKINLIVINQKLFTSVFQVRVIINNTIAYNGLILLTYLHRQQKSHWSGSEQQQVAVPPRVISRTRSG